MASVLPPTVVLTRGQSSSYLTFVNVGAQRGDIRSRGGQVFNPLVKIEVETASVNRRFVHLRFSFSNRYWARDGVGATQVTAKLDQPEEDTSKWSCTLFEPTMRSGLLYLRHVQSGQFARFASSLLQLGDGRLPNLDSSFAFRFVNWDSIVIMPKHIAFRGHNNRYLQVVAPREGRPLLEFSSDDGGGEECAYEIEMFPDGMVRIITNLYSNQNFHRYWGRDRTGNLVIADAYSNMALFFTPIRVNNTTISLRSLLNDRFCVARATDNRLAWEASTLSTRTRLEVEELVLERQILDLHYRMEDARIYDEAPYAAGFGFAHNRTPRETTMIITVSSEDTNEYSFANSLSINLGFSLSVTTRIPLVAEKQFTFSTEIINSFEWTRTTSETRTVSGSYEVTVPPMSTARVNFVATRGRCNVPFTYVQRDRLAKDGSFVTREETDGVFNGVNNYNFHFENLEIQSLSNDAPEGTPVSRL